MKSGFLFLIKVHSLQAIRVVIATHFCSSNLKKSGCGRPPNHYSVVFLVLLDHYGPISAKCPHHSGFVLSPFKYSPGIVWMVPWKSMFVVSVMSLSMLSIWFRRRVRRQRSGGCTDIRALLRNSHQILFDLLSDDLVYTGDALRVVLVKCKLLQATSIAAEAAPLFGILDNNHATAALRSFGIPHPQCLTLLSSLRSALVSWTARAWTFSVASPSRL